MLVFALPRICILAQTLCSWWAGSCELPWRDPAALNPRDTNTGFSGGAECCIHIPTFVIRGTEGGQTHPFVVAQEAMLRLQPSDWNTSAAQEMTKHGLHHSQGLSYSRGKVVMDTGVQLWESVYFPNATTDESFSPPNPFSFIILTTQTCVSGNRIGNFYKLILPTKTVRKEKNFTWKSRSHHLLEQT